jgi:metal-responsive CopG/Arc/MetJ family transcriptional regulator
MKNEGKAERTQISVRLSAELLNRIDRVAKKERRNRSNMIEYILRESIPAMEKK